MAIESHQLQAPASEKRAVHCLRTHRQPSLLVRLRDDERTDDDLTSDDESRESGGAEAHAAIIPNNATASSPSATGTARPLKRMRGNEGGAGVRRGKWIPEEQAYAARLISDFENGLLPLQNGATLRAYLSTKLNCDPMRISKKFAGVHCLGKQVFQKSGAIPFKQFDPEPLVSSESLRAELGVLEDNFLRAAAAHGARRRNRPQSAAQQAKAASAAAAAADHTTSNLPSNNGYSTADGHFAPNGVWRALRTSSSGATSADSGCRDSDDELDENGRREGRSSPTGRGHHHPYHDAFAKRASKASLQQQRLGLMVECDFSIGGAGDCGRGGAYRGSSEETGAPPSMMPPHHQGHHSGAMSDAEWLGEATLGDVSDDMDDLLDHHHGNTSRCLGRSSFMPHLSSSSFAKNSSCGYTGTPTSVAPVPFSSLEIQDAPLLVAPSPTPPGTLASASLAPPSTASSGQGDVVAAPASAPQAPSSSARDSTAGALDESLGSFFSAGGELSTDLGDFLPDECFSFI